MIVMIKQRFSSTSSPISLADLERDSVIVEKLADSLHKAFAGEVDTQYRTEHFGAVGMKPQPSLRRPNR
jgi:hypothetical protein